ncbi:MAG: hypothetical protein IK073_04895 [Paludibacteraceae bacterium]|nr:hypothetical protein [Paludibacteraceae bacterium]
MATTLDALQQVRKTTFAMDIMKTKLAEQRQEAVCFIRENYPERFHDGTEFAHKGGIFSVTTRYTVELTEVTNQRLVRQLEAKLRRKTNLAEKLSTVNRDIYKLEKIICKKYPDAAKPYYILHVTRKSVQNLDKKKANKKKEAKKN